jgi:hypothetical protein
LKEARAGSQYGNIVSMSTVSQSNPMKGKRKSYLLRIDEEVWNERKKLNPPKQSVGL